MNCSTKSFAFASSFGTLLTSILRTYGSQAENVMFPYSISFLSLPNISGPIFNTPTSQSIANWEHPQLGSIFETNVAAESRKGLFSETAAPENEIASSYRACQASAHRFPTPGILSCAYYFEADFSFVSR